MQMALWVGLAVMAAAVVAVLLAPLLRERSRADRSGDPTAIYRDQLRELDQEFARGAFGQSEYHTARTEVARRLIAASNFDPATGEAENPQVLPPKGLALAIAAAVPISALAIYLTIGAPQLPAQPFAARLKAPVETARVDELVRAVETRLREQPGDGQGWDVVAPVYLKQGRYRDAADAFAKALRLLGETPKRLAGFAEATVLDNDGIVTEPARIAYDKLVKLEPARPEPRFWLALAKEQDGRLDAAAADYDALIQSAPPGATWTDLIVGRREALRAQMSGARSTPLADAVKGASGPSTADIAAAETMSAPDRQKMIEGMVQGLADRLAQNGHDLPGWERLIRAYSTLGRKTEAEAALGKARKSFTGDAAALATLTELARALGLQS